MVYTEHKQFFTILQAKILARAIQADPLSYTGWLRANMKP